MKPLLPALLSFSAPILSVLALAAIFGALTQHPQENASQDLPDFHSPTYVGGQFYAHEAVDAHNHFAAHLSAMNVNLVSRHPRH